MTIAENVAAVRANIRQAALEAGREAKDIILIAATKMNDADRVRQAIAAGVDACGENRVQELLEKNAQGAYEGAALHFIGRLQKNKVNKVVGTVSLIHSVDSMELLAAIDRAACNKGVKQDVLLEINAAGEASKAGFAPENTALILSQIAGMKGIFVRGLMTIPPKCASPEENRPYFLMMKQLLVDNSAKKYDNVSMDFLSMGMSGDYTAAVACGANMVRVGSAIFGERIYPAR